MALPTEILMQVDQVTLGYTAKAYQAVVSAHMGELRLMLVIYVAMFGIGVLQGMIPLTLQQAAKHILKALIIFQLATNWGTFTTFFYNVFTSGPDKLTAALLGGNAPTKQLEDVYTVGIEAAQNIFRKAGAFDVAQILLAGLVTIGTVFMVGVALFLLIFAKMGLAVLLSIAPIFLALALWKSTQGLFQGWINYLVHFAMIPVITYAVMGLALQLIQAPVNEMKAAGENLTMVTTTPYLLMGAITTLLCSQILKIAASLGGGITLSAMGAFTRYVTRPTTAATKMIATKAAPAASKYAGTKASSMMRTKEEK